MAGVTFDLTKGYIGAFLLIVGGAIATAILVLLCRRPKLLSPFTKDHHNHDIAVKEN